MNRIILGAAAAPILILTACSAGADEGAALAIASAITAAPPSITDHATIRTMEGAVLRAGSNGWTCYPGSKMTGPMCNQAPWDALLTAYMAKTPPEIKQFGVSYMLAGEADGMGASNIDPFATEPTPDNQWVKEGPHLMIVLPDPAALEGISTDPKDTVYVMWKGTPYAHIMVRVAAAPKS